MNHVSWNIPKKLTSHLVKIIEKYFYIYFLGCADFEAWKKVRKWKGKVTKNIYEQVAVSNHFYMTSESEIPNAFEFW